MKFKEFCKTLKHYIFITSDIESMLKPISSCESNVQKSFHENLNTHKAIAAGFYVHSNIDSEKISKYKYFFGEKCIEEYLKCLINEC